MTLRDQLESLIDIQSYESCWCNTIPPSFDAFMKFTVSAFENALPDDATNVKITINSSTNGRINTVGSFRRGTDEYEVFGQIVWVDKHRFFRGKPGFRKRRGPVLAPADTSDTYTMVSDTTRDLNGFGTILNVSPRLLVQAFGKPGEADGFKVSGIYIFEGNRGSAFRINDYEETTLYWGEERQGEYPTPREYWNSEQICDFPRCRQCRPFCVHSMG